MFRTRRDESTFRDLAEVLEGGNVIAFIGAGVSARVGYQNWDELLKALATTAAQERETQQLGTWSERVGDMLWLAEHYRSRLSEEAYQGVLARHFGPKPDHRIGEDECLAAIVKLPFRHIMTTNYDSSIEQGFRVHSRACPKVLTWTRDEDVRILMRSFPKSEERYLVYLHGRYDDPARTILTERDYVQRYVTSDATVRRLFAMFSMSTVLFLGFSMTDPDLMSIFRQVNSAHGAPRHFAFLPAGDNEPFENVRARLEIKYGVRLISYEVDRSGDGHGPSCDPHHRLVALLNALVEATVPGATQGPSTEKGMKWISAVRPGSARSSHGHSRMELWTDTPEFRTSKGKADPEDPQKGRFGGVASRPGRTLRAVVAEDPASPEWYVVDLIVEGTPENPLEGTVDFYLHPTFRREIVPGVPVTRGRAKLRLSAWGAFTVGAIVDDGQVALELDLAALSGAPRKFRSR